MTWGRITPTRGMPQSVLWGSHHKAWLWVTLKSHLELFMPSGGLGASIWPPKTLVFPGRGGKRSPIRLIENP